MSYKQRAIRSGWILVLTFGGLLLQAAAVQNQTRPEILLQRAMQKEIVDGEPKAAIELYKQVADGKDRALAAKALLRMAELYEKAGDVEAQKAYQLIVEKFSDQKQDASQARTRLAALQPVPKYKGLTKLPTDGYPASYWEGVTADGRYLYFVGRSQGGLVLHDLASGEEKKVFVGDASYKGAGVLSPDGKSVAFSGFAGSDLWDVFAAPVSGGTPAKALLNNKEFTLGSRPFGWSSDNKQVFALLERNDRTWLIAKVSAANGSIQIIKSLEWRVPSRLSVSPDGRFIAYDAPVSKESPKDRDVFLIAVDGSREVVVAEDPAWDENPVWTPDGKAIVFTSSRLGDLSLFSITVNDGKPQRTASLLRKNVGQHEPLGFTPDGSYYYRTGAQRFVSMLTGSQIDWGAGTMSAEKTIGPISVCCGFGGELYSAARYSPDGQKLAYLSARGSGRFLSIVVRSNNGESEVQTMFRSAGNLSWFPDGQSVMFSARDITGANGIHRIDLKSGEDLIKDRLNGTYPVPSPDGKTIYYVKSSSALMAYDLESKHEAELLRFQTPIFGGSELVVSPDGRDIASMLLETQVPTPANPGSQANAPTVAVAVVSTVGGPIRKLRSPQPGRIRIIQWSADGKNVLVQTLYDGPPQLWRVPADGAEPQKGPDMGNVPGDTIISMRSDGKEIALSTPIAADEGELWVDPDLLRSKTPNAARQEDGIYAARLDPMTGNISGSAELIVPSPDLNCAPVWSPDGKAVSFFRGANRTQMILRAIDTGVEKTIQSSQSTPCPTVLFRDGHDVLAWPRTGETGTHPARLDLNTGKLQFINISAPSDAIALSTDDKTLFLTIYDEKSKTTSIESVNLATLERKRVWASPFPTETVDYVDRKLALSPDGRTLALVLSDSKRAHLIRVGTDGAGYRILYSAAKPRSDSGNPELWPGGLSWTRDGRALLFMEKDKTDHLRVMHVPAEGGKPKFTGLDISRTTLPGGSWHTISDLVVISDGRRIAFWSPLRPRIGSAASSVN